MVSACIRSLVDDDSEEPRREKRVRRLEIERQNVSLITPKPTVVRRTSKPAGIFASCLFVVLRPVWMPLADYGRQKNNTHNSAIEIIGVIQLLFPGPVIAQM